MTNPKLVAQAGEILGHAPEDAVLLLPRDGAQWIAQSMDKGPKKFSIGSMVADSVMKNEVRPGGHVLGLPFPPENPVVWALTPTAAVCMDTVAGFGRWKPARVFASFDYAALDRVWHEKTGMNMFGVHVTMRDGNHWEFSIGKGELKKHYQAFEQELLARIARAGQGQGAPGAPAAAGQAPGAPGGAPGQAPQGGGQDGAGLWQPGPPLGAPHGEPGQWQPGPPQGQPGRW